MGQKMQSKWKFTPLRMAWITLYLIEHWPLFELKSSLIFFLHVRRHIRSGKIRHDKKVIVRSLSKNIYSLMPDVSHYTRSGYNNHFFNFLALIYTIIFALSNKRHDFMTKIDWGHGQDYRVHCTTFYFLRLLSCKVVYRYIYVLWIVQVQGPGSSCEQHFQIYV